MIRIGLQLHFQDHYDTEVAIGVLDYARKKSDWEINGQGYWFQNSHERLDGLIARIESQEEMDACEQLQVPVVDIAGAIKSDHFSVVSNDDWNTGMQCGVYMRGLGASHYAMCVASGTSWSHQRMLGFCNGCGINIEKLPYFAKSLDWWQNLYVEKTPALEQWLLGLPKPVCLFCCNDLSAMKVTMVLRRLNISIPNEVAILGVDNEELLCMLAKPTISSMELQLKKIGYKAAEVLDLILTCASKGRTIIEIPPRNVVERESTAIIMESDRLVAQALRIIKEKGSSGICAQDVIDKLPCSRRTIENHFRKAKGRTLNAEIQDTRLALAVSLLRTTDHSICQIREESGFGSLQRFYSVFHDKYGTSPADWRKKQR